jgi:DNA polymerase-3 subunit delta
MAEAPRFYVFYGPDEFTQKETLADLKNKMGDDPAMVDLNTSYFDGRHVSLGELRHACSSFPFLSEKRLVVVEGLLSRLEGKEREALLAFLPELPSTTRLVFLEESGLSANNPFVKLAHSSPAGYARLFEVPKGRSLEGWIQQRVEAHGGTVDPRAAALLAANVGEDLRLLEMEIRKLVTYTGLKRPIRPDDVELLTPYAEQVVIFDLVDAIGQRERQVATTLLRRKLEEGEEPLYLLAMIIRQFRLLIQVKEQQEQGASTEEISQLIHLHPYATGKIAQQANNYTLERLEAIYRQLLDTDVAIKTGQVEPEVAVDLLVLELAT